jgi:hypothetical protein
VESRTHENNGRRVREELIDPGRVLHVDEEAESAASRAALGRSKPAKITKR